MKGCTLKFISSHFGCTERECEFIDNLCDNDFPSFGDWYDDVFDNYYGGQKLSDYLIRALFDEVIYFYSQNGLDEDKFSAEIDTVNSRLLYDGKKVTEEDLNNLSEESRSI